MAPSRSSPEIAYYRGAYDECRRLLTSPRFTRPQRELIESEAHRIKAELASRGIAFEPPVPAA